MLVIRFLLQKVKSCGERLKSCGYMSHGNIPSQRWCKNKIKLALLKIYFGKKILTNFQKAIMSALPLEESDDLV